VIFQNKLFALVIVCPVFGHFRKKKLFVIKMIKCFDFTCLACEKGGFDCVAIDLEKKRSILNCFQSENNSSGKEKKMFCFV